MRPTNDELVKLAPNSRRRKERREPEKKTTYYCLVGSKSKSKLQAPPGCLAGSKSSSKLQAPPGRGVLVATRTVWCCLPQRMRGTSLDKRRCDPASVCVTQIQYLFVIQVLMIHLGKRYESGEYHSISYSGIPW